MKVIELKDWIGTALELWADIVATISLIVLIRNRSKKKPPHRSNPHKAKRKGR